MKLGLQLFAAEPEAVSGSKIVYLYRIASKAATADGAGLAFTTENSRTKSKDADVTVTKSGTIRTPSAAEVEITATSILSKGDKLIKDLEDAMDKDELIEVWEANLDDPVTPGGVGNKYHGTYFQGYLTELEINSNSEDNVEISLTFGINGSGARGEVTVSEAQKALANYVFKDTTKTAV